MGLIASVRALLSTNELADNRPSDLRTDREGALWVHLRDLLVQAAGAVGAPRAEPTIAPTTGGLNVHIVGGGTSGPSPSTLYASTALEASAVISAAACTFRRLTVEVDKSAPTGTYYAQLHNAAALPADGVAPRIAAEIDHVYGTADRVPFDAGEAGVSFSNGVVACLSTTRLTKTIAGAYCVFTGETVPS